MKSQPSIILKGTVLSLALASVACSSAPERPDQALTRAETSVELAEQNDAREFGPTPLQRAQDQLEQAQTAASDKDYEAALQLAERAELDAELALAQTNHQKAVLALLEIQESIETLRQEITRSQSG